MDVTLESDIRNVVDTIIRQEGRIDVLWNNAGYGLYGAVEDVPVEEARQQFEVNLFGLAAITQQVITCMRKAKRGMIINTSSMRGKIYTLLYIMECLNIHSVTIPGSLFSLVYEPDNRS